MDRYQKVERPKAESAINENEIRITSQGLVRNYINYATTLFQERRGKEIVLKAMGQAINKTVAIAEIIKRRIPQLHQDTAISSESIVDIWEPIEEGLLPVEMTRHVSMISITLSPKELNKNSPGYQAPSLVEQTRPRYNYQQQQQPRQSQNNYQQQPTRQSQNNYQQQPTRQSQNNYQQQPTRQSQYNYQQQQQPRQSQYNYQQQQQPRQARLTYNAVEEDTYERGQVRGRGRGRGGRGWNRGGYENYQESSRGGYGNYQERSRGGYENYQDRRRGGYENYQERSKGGYENYQERSKGGYENYQENGGYANWGRGGSRGGNWGYRGGRGRAGGGRGYGGGRGRMGSRPVDDGYLA